MNNQSNSLWLHISSGKESGIAIIGTPETLARLAAQLLKATDSPEQLPKNIAFPALVASPAIVSPYSDVTDFGLTFYVDRGEPLQKLFPQQKRSPSLLLFLSVVVCSITGAVNILAWIKSFF